MAEYSELEALQAFTDELIKKLRLDGDCDQYTSGGEESAVRITKAFAANVVEVVRCRDCLSWIRYSNRTNGECFCHNRMTYGDDFCSYGERKEDTK